LDVAACRVSPSKLGRPLVGLRRSFASSLSGKTPQPVGCGVFRQKHPRLLFLFLIPLVIAGFDEGAAEAYGKVRAALETQGKPIGALDTLSPPVFYFTPRDEDVGFVAGPVPVHRRAGGTAGSSTPPPTRLTRAVPIEGLSAYQGGSGYRCVFRLAYENRQCTAESQHSAILRRCNCKIETPCDYALISAPLPNRIRLASHQTPIDAAHIFLVEDWQVCFYQTTSGPSHPLGANEWATILLEFCDLLNKIVGWLVVVEGDHIIPWFTLTLSPVYTSESRKRSTSS